VEVADDPVAVDGELKPLTGPDTAANADADAHGRALAQFRCVGHIGGPSPRSIRYLLVTMPPSPRPDAFVHNCPSRAVLARIGEKWTTLALVWLDENGPTRFGALQRRLEGVSQKMLTQTLRHLERDGLVERRLFDEMPLRVEYSLTGLGRTLVPLVRDLKAWAERHLHAIERSNAAYDTEPIA
jgi:DNA-binding HxlR family transcriptional regulator